MTLSIDEGQLNAGARNNESLRQTLLAITRKLTQHDTALGLGAITKVDAATLKTSAAPAPSKLSAVGANGQITVSIALPQQATGAPQNASKAVIYQEISTSSVANFTSGVFTYPLTTTTSMTIAAPGQTLWLRLRSSADQKTFNAYQVFGPVAAGLQTSAATNPNLPLCQSNFATVDSIAAGGSATVRIYGSSGGVGTSWPSILGGNSKVIPAGTILNVPYGSNGFVAWDGSKYQFKAGLTQTFPDSWTPAGAVSVISNGAGLVLPLITPVITGGHIIGYDVTNGGNDITGPLSFTIVDSGGGSGATVGPATVSGGVLQSLGTGNPGALYTGATTVTATGGISGGVGGGGGPQGSNNGRLYTT